MKDTRSLLLLLLSLGLISTWIFHFYDKTTYAHQKTGIVTSSDSVTIARAVRDSLDKMYAGVIKELDTKAFSSEQLADSLSDTLQVKVEELNGLKAEIDDILKNQMFSGVDLSLANKKIRELQQRVNDLKEENEAMKDETGKLKGIIKQFTADIEGLQENVKKLTEENNTLAAKISIASLFVVSEINLNAVSVKKQKEQVTTSSKKANKLVASFLLQNPVYDFTSAEVIVVVIQPDGQVLKNEKLGSGTFETKDDAAMDFTKKIQFDYNKGERRRVAFSYQPEQIQKGSYQLQVWQKGILIGQASKTFS